MIVFSSTAKEMIVAVIFPLKSWNISIIYTYMRLYMLFYKSKNILFK